MSLEPTQPDNMALLDCVLVVPCYNEQYRLDLSAFVEFHRQYPCIRFIFVNDGSHDSTLDMLQQFQQQHPECIEVLDLERNRGKAEAIRQGLLLALRRNVPVIGFWDADLATPLEEAPRLLSILTQQPQMEMVIAARVQLLGRQIHRRAVRHYLGRIFASLASWVIALPVYDTQCGAKLFRATSHLPAILERPFSSRWIFDVELIDRFLRLPIEEGELPRSQRIVEYPLQKWTDVAGSKLRSLDCFQAAFDLLKLAIYRRRAG